MDSPVLTRKYKTVQKIIRDKHSSLFWPIGAFQSGLSCPYSKILDIPNIFSGTNALAYFDPQEPTTVEYHVLTHKCETFQENFLEPNTLAYIGPQEPTRLEHVLSPKDKTILKTFLGQTL